jgi:hypothetical protein
MKKWVEIGAPKQGDKRLLIYDGYRSAAGPGRAVASEYASLVR